MAVDRWVLVVGGALVLTSITLGYTVHLGWLWLGVFVGANMLQAAFSGFCPLAMILKKLGVKPGAAF